MDWWGNSEGEKALAHQRERVAPEARLKLIRALPPTFLSHRSPSIPEPASVF